jgi:hypothetical protein
MERESAAVLKAMPVRRCLELSPALLAYASIVELLRAPKNESGDIFRIPGGGMLKFNAAISTRSAEIIRADIRFW